jgi:DNA-binding MarR family transcriptional regulator
VIRDSVDLIEEAWRRERPDVDSSSIGIVTRIWRLGRFLDRARGVALAKLDTDAAKLDALATLRRAGKPYRLTAGEMQRRSLVTAGAVTQRLDKLERAGLVRREGDEEDGRVVHVVLMPRGRRAVDGIFVALMEQEQALLAPFSREEREVLTALLSRWLGWFEAGGVDAATGTPSVTLPEREGTGCDSRNPIARDRPRIRGDA